MFDLADLVPLTITITDASGNLANASAVTVTVTLPDGSTDTPVVDNPTIGRYQADYQPPMPGRYLARWVATGSNASGFTDTFDVREAAPPFIVSLADAKVQLNMDSNTDDEELRGVIEAATRVIEGKVGPVVVRPFTETKPPARVIVVNHIPAITLTSITPVRNNSIAYDVSMLDFDPNTGVIRRLDGGWIGIYGSFGGVGSYYGSDYAGDALRVTYTAGRRIIPATMTMAAKLIIADMWETQRGHPAGRRLGLGRDPQEEILNEPGLSLKIRRVLEMLEPDRRAALMA